MKFENGKIYCDCGKELEEGDYGIDEDINVESGYGTRFGAGTCPECGYKEFDLKFDIVNIRVEEVWQ